MRANKRPKTQSRPKSNCRRADAAAVTAMASGPATIHHHRDQLSNRAPPKTANNSGVTTVFHSFFAGVGDETLAGRRRGNSVIVRAGLPDGTSRITIPSRPRFAQARAGATPARLTAGRACLHGHGPAPTSCSRSGPRFWRAWHRRSCP
jgi:hypothetical protein